MLLSYISEPFPAIDGMKPDQTYNHIPIEWLSNKIDLSIPIQDQYDVKKLASLNPWNSSVIRIPCGYKSSIIHFGVDAEHLDK
jgi:hypothetical protein